MANTSGYGYLLGPAPQFFDANGKPLVGGKLFVYIAGTTTTAVTYSDFNRTENTNPVILNSLGTCMLIVPSANLYKIVLYDRNGNLLLTRDNVSVSSEQQIIYTTANRVDSSDSTVDVTATTDPDTGIVTYDLSIQKEIDRAEGAEGDLAEDIADETDRAKTAEKAAKTEVVAGDNITVTKTVGANGQNVYTIDGEAGDNIVEDVRVNGASVVTDKVANIDVPVAGTASPLMDGTASAGASGKYAREDHVHPSDTSREAVSNKTTVVLGASDSKYPTDKAVWDFVNSSIATNTAYYISDNGEPFTSVEELEAYSGTVTHNDYAFVTGTDSAGNTYYDRYKATVRDSTVTWALEYRLNNSSFTAAQWAAINSGITAALVAKIHEHSNKAVLDGITATDVSNWNGKKDKQTAVTFTGSTLKTPTSMTQDANGAMAVTFTDIQSASTSQKGVVQLSDAVNSTDTDKAATAKAVKTAYDLASTKITKVSGATEGNIPVFDANGEVVDSGKKPSDFEPTSDANEVSAAALNEINARLESVEDRKNFGDLIAETVSMQEFPLVGGKSMVLFGSSAPDSAPSYAGQLYLDLTNKNLYFSVGQSSASDWVLAKKKPDVIDAEYDVANATLVLKNVSIEVTST